MAGQKGQAINACYLALGKSLLDDLDGSAVLLAPIHRHQYRSVYDEKVRIRCRNPLVLFIVVSLGPGEGKQPKRPALHGSKGPQLLGHCFEGTVVFVRLGRHTPYRRWCHRGRTEPGCPHGNRYHPRPGDRFRSTVSVGLQALDTERPQCRCGKDADCGWG